MAVFVHQWACVSKTNNIQLTINNITKTSMNYQVLEELDIIVSGTQKERSQWIHKQSDLDLYQVGTWLMMHLTPNYSERNHLRSDVREMLSRWNGKSWTDKQRHYLGHSIIDFWPIRQLDQDPRYIW